MTGIFFKKRKVTPSKQQGEIWEDVRRSLREQFPNPQREGCPGRALLAQLAVGHMPLKQAEPWLDHFSRCSPCFRDFEELQAEVRSRRRWMWGVAAAAAAIMSASLALWLTYAHEKSLKATSQPSTPNTSIALNKTDPLPVTLHLENTSTTRSPDGSEPNPQQLPRSRISLSIYLPTGSEPGPYEIEFRKTIDSTPGAKFQGNTGIFDRAAVLNTSIDLSGLDPGTYILAFRHTDGRWRYSRITIS